MYRQSQERTLASQPRNLRPCAYRNATGEEPGRWRYAVVRCTFEEGPIGLGARPKHPRREDYRHAHIKSVWRCKTRNGCRTGQAVLRVQREALGYSDMFDI